MALTSTGTPWRSRNCRTLLHAGLPHDRFCFGGADYGEEFLLDDRDRLTDFAEDRLNDPDKR